MSVEFTVVERGSWRGRQPNPWIAPLIETCATGKALRIPLNGTEIHVLRNRLTQAVRRRSPAYRLHTCRDGEALVCWAEKKA